MKVIIEHTQSFVLNMMFQSFQVFQIGSDKMDSQKEFEVSGSVTATAVAGQVLACGGKDNDVKLFNLETQVRYFSKIVSLVTTAVVYMSTNFVSLIS